MSHRSPRRNATSPNSLQCEIRVPADGRPKFPFFIAGPVLGAVIGIVHVGSMAMVWAYHGFPDFFFRTTEWALVGGFLMAVVGSMFGVLYGIVVALLFRTLRLQLNLRFHNWKLRTLRSLAQHLGIILLQLTNGFQLRTPVCLDSSS